MADSSGITREWRAVLRSDPCAYCGAPATEIDHIENRYGGGPDHWTNATGACRSCNASKREQKLLGFLLRDRRLMLSRWPRPAITGDFEHTLSRIGEDRRRAEQLRLTAKATLVKAIPAAKNAGIPIAEIARLSHMTRQAVYDVLAVHGK